MEFASEMIIKAIKDGLKITQVNINFFKDARKKQRTLACFLGWNETFKSNFLRIN